jgi:GR25 family glycosyltransferase involved in LPS biosynthesis
VDPYYSLGDQLFVEPQPQAIPEKFDLERPIRMTEPEIAVASSHIGVWKALADSDSQFSLVIEDDVWFDRGFGRELDSAWRELEEIGAGTPDFDLLYVSYQEVRHGAPKELISKNVFCPERGLWFLSGYVLSRKGAQALIDRLPCRGPVDLWINHQFSTLKVRALRRAVVNQRRDLHSTNLYSILPTLSRIGVIDSSDAALFHRRPSHAPVFVFGTPGSGLSSTAMALSMLGYRCCHDLEDIPQVELEKLLSGSRDRVFDAYVNIGALASQFPKLIKQYPRAKYVVLFDFAPFVNEFDAHTRDLVAKLDVLHVGREQELGWRALCEHLSVAPPVAPYPNMADIGLRRSRESIVEGGYRVATKRLQHDPSPWIVGPRDAWAGISIEMLEVQEPPGWSRVSFGDDLEEVRPDRWVLRNDTFPGNLGLFRPENVDSTSNDGLILKVVEAPLGVRNFGAAAFSSRSSFLFGRYEATLKATSVPGIVTGFFLHRDSPRQEIDVEILGNQPDRLLVNVFYNPGSEGAKFDYGYRGTPFLIELGFDASNGFHRYAIEWNPFEISWYVDDILVHRRATWNPTPIPHLPMTLHVNCWPTRSRDLAGRLVPSALPTYAIVRRVTVNAYSEDTPNQLRHTFDYPSTATEEG